VWAVWRYFEWLNLMVRKETTRHWRVRTIREMINFPRRVSSQSVLLVLFCFLFRCISFLANSMSMNESNCNTTRSITPQKTGILLSPNQTILRCDACGWVLNVSLALGTASWVPVMSKTADENDFKTIQARRGLQFPHLFFGVCTYVIVTSNMWILSTLEWKFQIIFSTGATTCGFVFCSPLAGL